MARPKNNGKSDLLKKKIQKKNKKFGAPVYVALLIVIVAMLVIGVQSFSGYLSYYSSCYDSYGNLIVSYDTYCYDMYGNLVLASSLTADSGFSGGEEIVDECEKKKMQDKNNCYGQGTGTSPIRAYAEDQATAACKKDVDYGCMAYENTEWLKNKEHCNKDEEGRVEDPPCYFRPSEPVELECGKPDCIQVAEGVNKDDWYCIDSWNFDYTNYICKQSIWA